MIKGAGRGMARNERRADRTGMTDPGTPQTGGVRGSGEGEEGAKTVDQLRDAARFTRR